MQHQKKLKEYKQNILNTLSTGQLKSLAGYYAFEPRELLNFSNQSRRKFIPTRDDYIQVIMNNLGTIEIIEWCRKQRIYQIEQIVSGREAYMKKEGINERGVRININSEQSFTSKQLTPINTTETKQQESTESHIEWEPSSIVKEIVSRIEKMTVTRRFQNELAAHMFLLSKLDE
jgi:hypothetical protein